MEQRPLEKRESPKSLTSRGNVLMLNTLLICVFMLSNNINIFAQINLNSGVARDVKGGIERARDRSRNTNNDNRTSPSERATEKYQQGRSTMENAADLEWRRQAEASIQQAEAKRRQAEAEAEEKAKRLSLSRSTAIQLKGVGRPIKSNTNIYPEKEKSKTQEVAEFVLSTARKQIVYGNVVSDPVRKEVANYIEKNVLHDFGLPAEYNKKISNTIAKKLIGNNKIEKLLIPKSVRPATMLLKAGVSPQAIDNGNWTASNVTKLCDKITENIILYTSGDISIEQYKENIDRLISSFKKSFAKQIAQNYKHW
jgi:hypothetical protein